MFLFENYTGRFVAGSVRTFLRACTTTVCLHLPCSLPEARGEDALPFNFLLRPKPSSGAKGSRISDRKLLLVTPRLSAAGEEGSEPHFLSVMCAADHVLVSLMHLYD